MNGARSSINPLGTLSLVALLLLVGCLAGPFGGAAGQERPVTTVVNNSANVTYTFEVRVVEFPSNVTVRRSDERVATGKIGQGLTNRQPGPYHYTAVELNEPSRIHGRYTLAPGEEIRTSIEEFPTSLAVVVIVFQSENEIIAWMSANCDDVALAGLRVSPVDMTARALRIPASSDSRVGSAVPTMMLWTVQICQKGLADGPTR